MARALCTMSYTTKQNILTFPSRPGVRMRVCFSSLKPIPVPRLRGHGDPAPSGGPPAASATCASPGLSPSGLRLFATAMVYGATLPRTPGNPRLRDAPPPPCGMLAQRLRHARPVGAQHCPADARPPGPAQHARGEELAIHGQDRPRPGPRADRPGAPARGGKHDLHAVAGHRAHGFGRGPHPVGDALRRHAPFTPWRAALAPPAHKPPQGRAPVPGHAGHAAHAGRDDDLRRDLVAAPKRPQLPGGRLAQRMRRHAGAARAHRHARPPGGGHPAGGRGEPAGPGAAAGRGAAPGGRRGQGEERGLPGRPVVARGEP